MKRIIPKPSKVRTLFFKDWYIRDFVFLTLALGIVVLFAFSNLKLNFVWASLVAFVSAGVFFVKIDDDRLYYCIFIYFRYKFTKKHFTNGEMTAIDNVVDGNVVSFKGGYYAGVLKISPMEFFLLREEVQDKLISAFSVIYKNLFVGQKISIVKLDRPIFLDGFISDIDKELQSKDTTCTLSKAKDYILHVRKEELEKINTINTFCYYNAFYVVVYGDNKETINKTLLTDVQELEINDIKTERVVGKELIGFLKRTFTLAFDEREIKDDANVKNYILPKKIAFSGKWTVVDDIKEKTFVINRFPVETFNAWATALCNIDYTKVVINASPVSTEKAIKQLDRSAQELEEQYSKTGKISKQAENEMHYASLKYLVEELGNNNEVMLDTSISVTAYDYDNKGNEFFRDIRKTINKLGFRSSAMNYKQAEAFRSATLNKAEVIPLVYHQGINSSSLASAFPFVATQIIEKDGVMLGENSAPVIIDFSKRNDKYKNSNVVVLGSVGGGKSFLAKTLFCNFLSKNYRQFILDPENEYSILAKNCGGQVIDMGSGGNIINPFTVLTDVTDESDNASNSLLEHLTFLEEFFKITLDGLSPENLELVLSLLPKLYAKHNITAKTNLKTFKGKYPTFDDFVKFIKECRTNCIVKEREKYDTIIMFIEKFATNGRYSFLWNGQTNLKTNADFIVFNFQTLLSNANKTIASAQMLLLTQYLNNELIHNFNKIKLGNDVQPIVIAIDEAHVFIDPNNPVALQFMKNTAKRCRKYNGMQVVLTQSVNDFLGGVALERESKAVITESQYTFVLPLNASSAQDFLKLYDKLDITPEEANEIMDNPRGTAFFIGHQRNRTSFRIIAPDKIRDLFEKQIELK